MYCIAMISYTNRNKRFSLWPLPRRLLPDLLNRFIALAEKFCPSIRSLARPPTAINIPPSQTSDQPSAARHFASP
jgi:hypothetical protein